jgi:glycerol-3-phosphate dehydrogenase subunit B
VSVAAVDANGSATQRVIVVGAGIAGTAAVIAAARAGAAVTVLDGGTGASTLATGALDLAPWPERPREPAGAIGADARATLDALGGYVVHPAGSILVTTAGLVRPAGGCDAALFDAAGLADGHMAVVRSSRPGWDAEALAHAWGPAYTAVDASVLRFADESVLPDAELALRHDDEARVGWLGDRLRDALARAGGRWSGVVLPPMLGIDRGRAQDLSRQVGARCGEPIALPGGPSGLRFERARDRALRASGAVRARLRARRLYADHAVWRVETEEGTSFEAHAVVVATGGLIGGGIEYAPIEGMRTATPRATARPTFRLAIDSPLSIGAYGRPLDAPGSLFGVAPESTAHPFVRDAVADRAGVLAAHDGAARGAPGVFVAGEIVADAARGWLACLASGVRAGTAAARFTAASTNVPRSPDARPPSRP